MTTKSSDLGVVIGRFQTNELHEGHVHLLDEVHRLHTQVLILLGCVRIRPNERDPLPFELRKQMLLSRYPQATVLPIFDSNISNEAWSEEVDQKVLATTLNGRARLYGSRDSFREQYRGQFKTVLVTALPNVSATSIRNTLAETDLNNPDVRKGWIMGTQAGFAITDMTVDVAIVTPDFSRVLMGKRHIVDLVIRFPGGFVDRADQSLEAAACREQAEEVTGIEAEAPIYIASTEVPDQRYANLRGRIMTTLFVMKHRLGDPVAGDDLAHVAWYPCDASLYELITPTHRRLVDLLLAHKAKQLQ